MEDALFLYSLTCTAILNNLAMTVEGWACDSAVWRSACFLSCRCKI